MNDKIKKLQKQIEEQKSLIKNCSHEFDEAFYNPTYVKEPYGSRTVGQGSDVWFEPEGYHNVKQDRWSRICEKCGFIEHTDKQEPVVTGYKPSF